MMAQAEQTRMPPVDPNERADSLSASSIHGFGWLRRPEPMTTASPALPRRPGLRMAPGIWARPRRIAEAPLQDVPPIRALQVSATLPANQAIAARLRRGQPVLPLAFGEAGLPVHPVLRAALAMPASCNS